MSENLGHDFNLPDAILSVIPTDPYDQLDLARKITSMAIASRVSNLESETGRLRQSLSEKDRVIAQLEEKVAVLEDACQDAQVQLRVTTEDNMRLSRERDSFAMTAKKLSRDLAKLETFKRQLMQSLSEDDSSQAETVDIETCEQIPKAYPITALMQTGQRAISPYITPRLTPTATPKVYSTNGSPRRYSSIESPQTTSGATSPTKSLYDGRASLSSWYPSSQQSSAASSPPRGRSTTARPPRIDGKEFFRQARSRLSYEQFSAFLANIKELNAQKQTREETLRKAEEIFGADNKDLYLLFQGLLNRNTKS
ncbi:uncharacterized protein At4g15545 isoform X2 [Daucus carota subsp. sativus]|uniref:uncharacterized protein At4g15545 isoform X2 n=1 Tax=Daucus carota subsp. sativus TaxID=79200 RepID=UPI0007F049E1|nr:PREDICTED: uncharacterized protein At4g15545 isoform X2 [Daucus carota subsp. sativus]